MKSQFQLFAGIALLLVGVMLLPFSLGIPFLGLDLGWWNVWRLWPLAVIASGVLFALPPLFVRGKRGLGALFIPALPTLATGGILLFTSVTDWWHAWTWLWPIEVLALALGFLLAAIYMRVIWLLVPTIIIGFNGLVLQFCAITGLWQAWAVLWTVEPLSVGLSFLIISFKTRSSGLLIAGCILCGIASLGLIGLTSLFVLNWWPLRLLGPVMLILMGLLLLGWAALHRAPAPMTAME